MAHKLEVVDGKASMFYVGQKPWHGLGTELPNLATAEEALKHAKLNFDVVKLPINQNGIVLPDKYATWRNDKLGSADGYLGVVGKNYEVIQNADLFSFFDTLVDEKEGLYETAGVLKNGSTVWILAKLNNSFSVNGNDEVNGYVLLSNSHDGFKCAVAKFTSVRVVCWNTLSASLSENANSISIRHTSNAVGRVKSAHELLGLSRQYFSEFKEVATALSLKKITDAELLSYCNSLLEIGKVDGGDDDASTRKINKRTRILELAEVGQGAEMCRGTAWGAVNAFTEYVDHEATYKNGQKAGGIFYGSGDLLKRRALEFAVSQFLN